MTLAQRPEGAPPRRFRRTAAMLLGATMLATGGVVAIGAPAASAVDCSTVPWMDTSKTADERTQALLAASTQHQKYRWLVEQPANDPTRTQWNPAFPGEAPVIYPAQVPCTPVVIYNNGPDGVYLAAGTTAWPGPIAVAATWNLELGEEKAIAHGSESFDKRNAVILGPGIASGRTPLSGRGSEYFGEDPVLSGLMAAANVNGLEDGNPDKPIIANLKHYVANEQEIAREESSSNMDERTFKQIYDLPYEIAVRKSDPGSLMCSYNQVNGVYACENDILTTSLREDYPFTGYVMSDFGSVHSTVESLNAGLDQELNRPIWFTPARLDAALQAGEITQARIDEAAYRVVHSYIDGGLFDHPVPATPVANVSTPEHKALAREIAEQSTVLLKNDGVLPLADGDLTVAVIGQTASTVPTGGVSAKTACAWAFPFGPPGGTALNCDALVDPLTALTERVTQAGGEVVYDNGADPAKAAAVASAADVALVFGYYTMGETKDLPDLRLDGNGDQLIEAVAASAPSTIAVLNAGSAVEMPWIDDVDAVFHAWHSGEQFGPALAALVYGDVNPSGKLPMTFPVSVDDIPTAGSEAQYPGVADENGILQVDYTEGLKVGYRWYEAEGIEPLFEFGHGLSYTEFSYGKVNVTPKSTTGDKEIRVRFKLTNTGDVAGTEVAQVYLQLPDAAGEPSKRLIGWERVTLQPGEHRNVEVALSPEDLADMHLLEYWDEDASAWTTPSGAFTVTVGGSVEAAAAATFTIR
ncbi:glycoside hydrolase family 3 C-terminal domain-containing protein [Microbacterium trichothecenolyticum]|uniref:Glycoside hydrolase family 3 C-terminal domain-containing protein n=1 Tax=Microbacterium ureisolvens TaxID=2781186 RepID=A0ABS7I2S4_9MICO|nr:MULTISPECIES: glycoside hydrolase family 3 C-terminal domain-containing protein [Microbacterium]MBW9111969.1 glycoside hydrolase family 3 C-terminal domain-containing protein [Microbacterium ureisolvens]MBW9122422.1 glycoside hydrolase family 3 C-terminal domain-containing protein [Microbacterium trichothecenolyticum]